MKRSTLVLLIGISLAAMTIACGSGSTSSKGSSQSDTVAGAGDKQAAVTTVAVGKPITITEDLLGTRTVYTLTLSNVKYNVHQSYSDADRGQFIVADVKLAVQKGKVSPISASFKIVDTDGTAYNTTIMVNADPSFLSASEVTAGQKTSGKIAFDAAAGIKHGSGAKVAIGSFLSDGDVGYWKL